MADILEYLCHNGGYLRKLDLIGCRLGEDSTGLLTNIVTLFPDLEVLSLDRCHPLTSAGYCLIPRLEKLSELNLTECQVDYVYVKPLEAHVQYVNACRRTPLEIYFIYI